MPKKPGRRPAQKAKRRFATRSGEPSARSGSAAPPPARPLPAAPTFQPAARPALRTSRAAAAAVPVDYSYVITDLKRIGVLAGGAVLTLVVLAVLLR